MSGFGHYGWLWLVAFAAIMIFALYRRGRRLIGRQRYSRRRVLVRTVVLAAAVLLITYSYLRQSGQLETWASVAAGFAVGVVIALVALRFTGMGRDERGIWYIPNLYLGIGLIALLVARYVYEYVVILPQARQASAAAAMPASTGLATTAVLHGLLFVVLGYYLCHYLGIYLRARRLEAEVSPDNSSEA